MLIPFIHLILIACIRCHLRTRTNWTPAIQVMLNTDAEKSDDILIDATMPAVEPADNSDEGGTTVQTVETISNNTDAEKSDNIPIDATSSAVEAMTNSDDCQRNDSLMDTSNSAAEVLLSASDGQFLDSLVGSTHQIYDVLFSENVDNEIIISEGANALLPGRFDDSVILLVVDNGVACPISSSLIESESVATNSANTETNDIQCKQRSRKRQRKPAEWARNKQKLCRQNGNEYVSAAGKIVEARKVGNHKIKCRFDCLEKFDDSDRSDIHADFWTLSDLEKRHYYARTVERMTKERTRLRPGSNQAKRKNHGKVFSFKYFFYNGLVKERVCKSFYLKTLDISQKRIASYFATCNEATGTPRPSRQGKHVKKRIADIDRQAVRDHINSFPRVESHYCRAWTLKQYLEPGLTISRMYELFCEKRAAENPDSEAQYIETVKKHFYAEIFNIEFNIGFHEPKSDRCDVCEAFKQLSVPLEKDTDSYNSHVAAKLATKEERDRDRLSDDDTHVIVSFDMENVIALPRANVSSFFYRRKLNVYNLTSHCSIGREGYCAIWHEGMSGRAGNDIASSLIRTMEEILKRHQSITTFTLWSDSCVPQNKNSVMSCAIVSFLMKNDRVKSVVQKFGVPGHSPVQEIDNLHSQIERRLKISEIYSPVGLMRVLKQVNRKTPLIIMQMKEFYDFQSVAKKMNFSDIPYSKVKTIVYENSRPLLKLRYGSSFIENELNDVFIDLKLRTRKQIGVKPSVFTLPTIAQQRRAVE
jgi:hypothetical protein